MNIWNKQYETMDRNEIEQLQLERLQITVIRAYRNVSFYRKLFDEANLIPEEINSMEKLAMIPFTSKETLSQSYPYGMFAVPLREIVRLQCTSGTTEKPIVVGYTKNDLEHWTEVCARVLTASGITKDDVVQICLDYGLFGGGLGFHYGAELIGASVIPAPNLDPEKQLLIMRDYHTTVLISTPTFALRLVKVLRKKRISPANFHLKIGVFTGEPFPETVREKIEEELNIIATENYGLSEIANPGVAVECKEKSGLHIFEDQFIPEIIDPCSKKILPLGQEGELVLTTITKEGFPLLRYRTGDITSLDASLCPCGRNLIRMKKVKGRTDDMMVINGVSLFPSQIGQILAKIIGEAQPHFRLSVNREETGDILEVLVEVSEKIFFDEMKKLVEIKTRIESEIYHLLSIKAKVKLVEPDLLS
ncbi:phenylacetate--CoA ligase [Candidatus Aerophobetes bacterium]|nr:phenylacetate--CoA ligase [Candidatus Aerophobetes bacterium]